MNTKYQEISNKSNSLNKKKHLLKRLRLKKQEWKNQTSGNIRLQQIQVSTFVSYSVLHLLNSESLSDFFNRLYVFQQLFQSDEEVLKNYQTSNWIISPENSSRTSVKQRVAKKNNTAESQAFEGSVNDLKKLIADNKKLLQKYRTKEKIICSGCLGYYSSSAVLPDKPAVASSTQQTPTTQAATAEPATTVAQTQAPHPETPTTQAAATSNQSGGRTLNVQATGYSYNEPGLSPYTATGIDL